MRIRFLMLSWILALVLGSASGAAAAAGFDWTQEGSGYSPAGVVAAADGGWVTVGSMGLMGMAKVLVARFDAEGKMLREATFGRAGETGELDALGPGVEVGGIARTSDGTYAVLEGFDVYGKKPMELLRLDDAGKELGRATIEVGEGVRNPKVIVAFGSDFLVAYEQRIDEGNDVGVARVDGKGKVAWSHLVNEGKTDWFGALHPTADGGCIVAVTSDKGTGGTMQVVKLDKKGSRTWIAEVGADIPGPKSIKGVRPDPTGGYLVAGLFKDDAGDYDPLLARLDDKGTQVWAKRCSENGLVYAMDVFRHSTGKLVALLATNNGTLRSLGLLVTDSEGEKIRTTELSLGAAGDTQALTTLVTDAGLLAVVGTVTPTGSEDYKAFLKVTDPTTLLQKLERFQNRPGRGGEGDEPKKGHRPGRNR